jgi:hypothetical protein
LIRSRFVDGEETELAALLERRAGADDVDGLFVLVAEASAPDPETVDPVLRRLSVPVFGGVFPEIFFEGERYSEGAVVGELPVEPTTTVVEELSDPDTAIRPQLQESVRMPGETTMFVFVDAFASRLGGFIERLFESYGLGCTFLGGGAGSLSTEQGPCLFTNEGLVEDGAVLATVELPSSLGVQHGWQEIDGPFRVNESDGTTLSTLGDEPAFPVYSRVVTADTGVPLTRENFFELAKSYPFGISRLHGEKIVRDPFSVADDGSLTCFGEIPEGEYLHVLRGEPASLIDAARAATESATGGDGPILSFDCISRVLYLGEQFEEELAVIGGPGDPVIGALTIGEIANDTGGHLQYYNKTVVVAQLQEV